eukprot:14361035-Ditylum_brightwellii.AAC.1
MPNTEISSHSAIPSQCLSTSITSSTTIVSNRHTMHFKGCVSWISTGNIVSNLLKKENDKGELKVCI